MRTLETDRDLYQRIKGFALSDPHALVSFESRLAAENHWTLGYAQAVTREYRRFLFLTQTAGQLVCPSHEVDLAWHQHLTQTRSYQRLCDEVLGRFLHHTESKGGSDELQRHRDMYRFTLSAYESSFGPPSAPEIWPGVEQRFGARDLLTPVTVWALPGFIASGWRHRLLLIFALSLVALMLNVLMGTSPWESVDGPSFAFVYLVLLVCVTSAFKLVQILQTAQTGSESHLDAYEVAMLKGGSDRVVGAAVTRLVQTGCLELLAQREGDKITGASCARTGNPVDPASLHPVERLYLTMLPEVPGSAVLNVAQTQTLCSPIRLRLEMAHLLLPSAAISRRSGLTALMLCLMLLVGFSRYWYGIGEKHPVAYLVLLILATTSALMAQLGTIGAVTAMGKKALKDIESRSVKLKSYAAGGGVIAGGAHASVPMLALAFALFGTQSVMASDDFAGINFLFGPKSNNNTGHSDNVAGCGGGGCGGGGCGGGGCGGGGCGGGCGG